MYIMNVSDILTHLCPKCLCLYIDIKLTNWTLELNMQTLNPRNWAFELPDHILKVVTVNVSLGFTARTQELNKIPLAPR